MYEPWIIFLEHIWVVEYFWVVMYSSIMIHKIYTGSYIGAHVLLNFFNELKKRYKMQCYSGDKNSTRPLVNTSEIYKVRVILLKAL